MLRRRSCCPEDIYSSLQKSLIGGEKTKYWLNDNRHKKLRASPIPEEDSTQKGSRKRPRSPEPKVEESFLKPSQIVQIQKVMPSSQSTSITDQSNDASANKLYSMWDGIFTWMKSAIDFVGVESTVTSDNPSPPKKRFVEEEDNKESNKSSHYQVHQGVSKRSNCRLALIPGITKQNSVEGDQDGYLPTEGSKICTTRSILASAEKFADNNDGLNGLLATPKSSNCAGRTVKKSSLKRILVETTQKENNSADNSDFKITESAPPPPPPPPVPPPPPPPPLVPPPKGPQALPVHRTRSHSTLQQMQNRLRTRMMKKTDEADSKNISAGTVVNFKTQQWIEIQAHKRKIPASEFLMLAKVKQSEIQVTLEQLKDEVPHSLDELKAIIERLQDGSLWFAGGYREMKEELVLYRVLEKKIELMNECLQIQEDMKSIVTAEICHIYHRPFVDLQCYLDLLRDEFNHKHKQWGPTLQTNALSWVESGLPVDKELLTKAREYLGLIVTKYIYLVSNEKEKLDETFFATKSTRITKLKDKLKDGFTLLTTYHYMCYSNIPSLCDPSCIDVHCSLSCVNNVLLQIALVVTCYVDICIREYNGHAHSSSRQNVCELFEGILKMNSSLKHWIKQTHLADQNKLSSTGVTHILLNSDKLAADLYLSCSLLIQHISKQSQSIMSSPANCTSSKEIILWMMFGCKYVNQTLEMLGSEQADERGVQNLLDQLQKMETLLDHP